MNEDGLIEINEAAQPSDLDYQRYSKKLTDKTVTGSKKSIDTVQESMVYQFFYSTDD